MADTAAALARERATREVVQQRALALERVNQQLSDQAERLTEHAGFRQSLEDKLAHAHAALEHYRTASREQRERDMLVRGAKLLDI
ncbi:hypothetical protein DID96_12210 [Burkholderia sp. Bp8963]|nr:hypothetical protein DID96_12210 [Burkholderia sp. Bp8963]